MYTREETLLAEEIRERQPVNFALENLGSKEMERNDNSLQNEQRFKGKKIWGMFMERGIELLRYFSMGNTSLTAASIMFQ